MHFQDEVDLIFLIYLELVRHLIVRAVLVKGQKFQRVASRLADGIGSNALSVGLRVPVNVLDNFEDIVGVTEVHELACPVGLDVHLL